MILELAKLLNCKSLGDVIAALRAQKSTSVIVNDPTAAPFLASAIKTPFVYVAPNREAAVHAGHILKNCGHRPAVCSAAPDMPIYTDINAVQNTELSSALNKFTNGQADVLVLAAETLLCNVPKVHSACFDIRVNGTCSVRQFTDTLVNFGYSRVQTISAAGEFSVRGDVVDIWEETASGPVRIMFFGNLIEAIKTIDIQTFLSTGKLDQVMIAPISELSNVSSELVIKKLREVKTSHENVVNTIKLLTELASQGKSVGGVRWLLPFLAELQPVLQAVLERAGKAAQKITVVFDRPREVYDAMKSAEEQNNMRLASLIAGGLLVPEHAKMFTTAGAVGAAVSGFNCVAFQNVNSQNPLFKATQVLELKTAAVPNYFNALSVLVPDIVRNTVTFGKTALVFVGSSRACENYMTTKQVPFVIGSPLNFAQGKINIIRRELSLSFELPDCNLVIYSTETPKAAPRQNVFQKTASQFVLPNVGEVVVHEVHGLGRYLGVKKLTLADAERDYIVLQYDGGAFVYLPPEQTNLLSNYQGEPTRLNRIGGQDFAAAKQRVRRRLKELSFKLSELYARRARVTSNVYEVDEKTEAQFAAAFPFALTADQQRAVDDIDTDMRGAKIMDRLICGDVGFGKTEVAFRAIFRAVLSGFQAALLCPTTILSVQHYNTAKARFGDFGVRVEVLNRFASDKQVASILEGLARGKVDVVIGTHRLLSPDVHFKNLGLLVLDEEQRFGVGAKERIKQLKHNIDVLTLSATPIPRTLNMALVGIRDISVITTPPENRFPVVTYVCEYNDALIADAIGRETARGGQTIVLYNKVEHINTFAARLARLLGQGAHRRQTPLIAVIHGQMPERQLEDTIAALYNKEIDVIIASTIIENGIDISTANTLFVIDADNLGAAQMHQLRGRVGRSNTQAFAYFTYAKNKQVSETSQNRLAAIQNFASGGAGLQIAMKDLQLRGAGSLLGANQSGHMEQIGFDTYCRILQEVAEENRGDNQGNSGANNDPVLDIAINSFIPQTYIANDSERMKVYVAISQIQNRADADNVVANLADLYGKIPPEVTNIVTIGYLRALARAQGVKHITLNRSECKITWNDGKKLPIKLAPNIKKLIDFLEENVHT